MNLERFAKPIAATADPAGRAKPRWTGSWPMLLATLAVVAAVLVALARWLIMPPVVTVAPLARGPAVQAVYATGTVEASVTIRIAPQIGGRLLELKADEGSWVAENEVLARLDDRDLRESVGELEARAAYAEQQFERASRLIATGATTRERLDQAQAELNAARHALRRAGEQLGFMSLRTPVAGTVIRRDGEIGDYIPLNQPVFYLAKAGMPLRISAEVDEEDIPLVRRGQTVLIRSDAFPQRVFRGEVKDITPKGDPVARSYRVRIALPSDTALLIGMTAEVNIVTAEKEGVLLAPSAAVKAGKAWLVRDGRLVAVPVTLGIKGRDRTEISGEVRDGDVLVAEPSPDLREGQRVRTRMQPPAAAAAAPSQAPR
ncbi:MAG: efflux RND transporter periplasmic adaptor subunit [Hyphomicrobiaceae bacterium]|nr:efflux RND transporter periplasmic adaptor subunit [Hyphomicrobiaceae bacterium]